MKVRILTIFLFLYYRALASSGNYYCEGTVVNDFLVLNDNRQDFTNPNTQINSRLVNQQGVFKVTYLKQF